MYIHADVYPVYIYLHPLGNIVWAVFGLTLQGYIQARAQYSGPSILRPPMGPWKSGLILQVFLK